MSPSTRTQPTLVARREGSHWVVTLPDGSVLRSPSDIVLRRRVHDVAMAAVDFGKRA